VSRKPSLHAPFETVLLELTHEPTRLAASEKAMGKQARSSSDVGKIGAEIVGANGKNLLENLSTSS
jgi:hypothetical protein